MSVFRWVSGWQLLANEWLKNNLGKIILTGRSVDEKLLFLSGFIELIFRRRK